MPREYVAAHCDRFLTDQVWSLLAKQGMQALEQHKQAGALVVLATASPDIYVSTLAARLGIDHVVCTELELDADGRFTGRLRNGNCYGPIKHRRIDEFLVARGAAWTDVTCYSDHASDLPLLLEAGRAYAVNPGRTFAQECCRRNIAVLRWT